MQRRVTVERPFVVGERLVKFLRALVEIGATQQRLHVVWIQRQSLCAVGNSLVELLLMSRKDET